MIKKNRQTTFLLTSILTITLLAVSVSSIQPAFAHNNPVGCFQTGSSVLLGVFSDPAATVPVFSAKDGDTVYYQADLGPIGGSQCAFEGGTVQIILPDATVVLATPAPQVQCIGGTGSDAVPFPCLVQVASQKSQIIPYVVDVTDDGSQAGPLGDTIKNNLLETDVTYGCAITVGGCDDGRSHFNVDDTPHTNDSTEIPLPILFEYDFTTLAENADQTVQGPVTDPTDTVSITGVDGVPGSFDVAAELDGPGGPYVASCDSVSSTGPGHLYSIDSTCTYTGDLTEPGQYCWDVTVTETGGNYDPSVVGPKAGIDDADNECFTITNTYDFTTLADNAGQTVPSPVSNPTDTVSITGVDGVPGSFDVAAELDGPGGPYVASCDSVSSTGPDHLYSIDSLCTYIGDLTEAGDYCWDVTVTETGGNYDPSVVGPKLGSDDAENECFTIEEELPTRTPGYWKTHYTQAVDYWPGFDCPGPSFPVGVDEYMGGMWAKQTQESDKTKRSDIDHERMKLWFQMGPAILNHEAFGSDPASFGTTLAEARTAFCGDDKAAIKTAHDNLSAFNVSGDLLPFPPGFSNTAATTAQAKAAADIPYWDQPNLPGAP